jgi:hypothetical protein
MLGLPCQQDLSMSNQGPPGKIVELPYAGARASPARIVAGLRGVAGKRLGGLMSALFDSVDDALFDMAERAGTNQNQSRYFEGMREIRRKRQQAEQSFAEAIARRMVDFEAGKLLPSTEASSAPAPAATREPLALVDEADLEESLAINAMVDRCVTRLQRPLYALEQRLAHVAGGKTVDTANDPIGPRQLSMDFNDAIRPFEIDLSVRLIVLKLFERHVLSNLEPMYDECNELLVQAGVLSDLRYAAAVQRRPAPPPRDSGAAAGTREAQNVLEEIGQQLDAQPQQTDHQILDLVTELRGLLAARHGPTASSPAAGTPGTGATPGLAPNLRAGAAGPGELLNALSLMQGQLRSLPMQADPGPVADAGTVKRQLLDTVRSFGGQAAPGHLGADEDTIDLVGMMFDYAVQDRNLPAPIQALLGRLQIPYLKVALMDREFVAQRNHPARKLLDQLADACVGWSEDSDKDGRLYGKVQETVTTLLREFDDDPSVFARLGNEFNEFVDKNRKRAELLERRAAEAASGRERLESAQRIAAREILSRVSGRNLPTSVRDLLTRRWSNYLVLTRLRYGEDSPEWRAATRFIDDFAWSVEPKKDDQDRLRLREMTPEIERLLKQGLAATGFHEGHLQELWEEVSTIYRAQTEPQPVAIGGAQTPPARAPADLNQADEAMTIRFASSRAGEEVVFTGDAADASPGDTLDAATLEALDTWLKIARALKTGTWFEFVKDDGSRERAKLLWISTIKALYLFVNRNGLKIAEKTATELAEELKDQKAVILEQVALVDRALDAILKQLNEQPAAEGSAADAPGTPGTDAAAAVVAPTPASALASTPAPAPASSTAALKPPAPAAVTTPPATLARTPFVVRPAVERPIAPRKPDEPGKR